MTCDMCHKLERVAVVKKTRGSGGIGAAARDRDRPLRLLQLSQFGGTFHALGRHIWSGGPAEVIDGIGSAGRGIWHPKCIPPPQ